MAFFSSDLGTRDRKSILPPKIKLAAAFQLQTLKRRPIVMSLVNGITDKVDDGLGTKTDTGPNQGVGDVRFCIGIACKVTERRNQKADYS